MKTLKIFLPLIFCFGIFSIKAQKLISGDTSLSFCKGQTLFNVEYIYDSLMVGTKTEKQYTTEKIKYFNADGEGKGDKWINIWNTSRSLLYEPKFEALINKYINTEGTGVVVKKETSAKYTIVLRTIKIEPGFAAVAFGSPSFCDFEILWKETSSGNIMAKAVLTGGPAMLDGLSDEFQKIKSYKECYAKAGKILGIKMSKVMFEKQ